MGSISKYLGDALLNHVFRGSAYSSPAKLYVALYTSNPGDTDTGTEVTGGSYARQEVVFSAPVDVSGKSTIKNTLDLTFPVATAAWGTVTHLGIKDALTSGNLLYYGAFTTEKAIAIGDQLKIAADNLVLDLD